MDEIILRSLAENHKIAGFTTSWQRFLGFSLLFDNPGEEVVSTKLISDNNTDENLNFYKAVRQAYHNLDPSLDESLLVCPVPYHSYHVTVLDGINDENIESIKNTELKSATTEFLNNLPKSLLDDQPLNKILEASPLITDKNWGIEFKFRRISTYSKRQALVVDLEPANSHAAQRYEKLIEERKKLYDDLKDFFQVNLNDIYEDFRPHISLGYFANQKGWLNAPDSFDDWNASFRKVMDGLTITYNSISLYGFENMVKFYNKSMVSLILKNG